MIGDDEKLAYIETYETPIKQANIAFAFMNH